jgi:putative flippase GtrA
MTTTAREPRRSAADLDPRTDEAPSSAMQPPVLDIVVPVYNEQAGLDASVRRLHEYVARELPVSVRITIVDNASTDATWPAACHLAHELPGIRAMRLASKGRGRALHAAWGESDATILAYMDVDLATDLAALHPLIAPLLSGHSDLAIGTRLSRNATVVRGPKRELISRAYNALLHATLHTRFSDAQCGFKAIRRDRAQLLLPLVKDNEWFFDTELLVLAERAGLRIHEVPVDWTDDQDSRVEIASTAAADLRGVFRLMRGLATGRIPLEALQAQIAPSSRVPGLWQQVVRFAAIGVLSTLAYVVLYVLLRLGMGPFYANALALLVTAIANTAANRRLTFGIASRVDAVKHQLQGLGVFAIALAVTSASLAGLHQADAHPARLLEAAVLVAANLVATALRFVLLRRWVFRRPATAEPYEEGA